MKVYTWGLGKTGQLGNGIASHRLHLNAGSLSNSTTPILVPIKNPISISSGGLFTIVLSDDGKVFTFGSGKNGRLGFDTETQTSPHQLSIPHKITQIAAGDWHAAALTDSGKVITWGYGRNGGGLGHGSNPGDSVTPKVVEGLTKAAIYVACGHNITLVITHDNELWAFGSFMGNGNDGLPYLVPGLSGKSIIQASAGFHHVAIVTSDGDLYVWGSNKDGALGLGKTREVASPTVVPGLSNVVQASCSTSEHHVHTAAITANGELYTWGSGYKGKLGNDNLDDCSTPQLVKTITTPVTQVSCGGIHTACVSNGELLTFGCGSDGRLGHPEATGHRYLYKEYTPRVVEAFQGKQVRNVSCSYYHSAALVQ